MKAPSSGKVEWTGLELDDLVWKHPTDNFRWGSELLIKENQAAAIFTKDKIFSRRLRMHDFFGNMGSYVISADSLLLVQKDYPNITSKAFLRANVIFCSTKDYLLSRKVYSGESMGQAVAGCEADARCRFRISNPKLFLATLVAMHKKTDDSRVIKYISKTLGIELFRRNRPYGWDSTQRIGIEDWKGMGIELLSLQFENYKESFGVAGA